MCPAPPASKPRCAAPWPIGPKGRTDVSKLRALTMPKWGIEMAEGTIAEWRIKAGDPIKKTQVIAMIETDKIANDLESEFDGTVARVVAEAGQVYPVGALLGVIATEAAADAEVDAFVKNFRAAEGSAARTSSKYSCRWRMTASVERNIGSTSTKRNICTLTASSDMAQAMMRSSHQRRSMIRGCRAPKCANTYRPSSWVVCSIWTISRSEKSSLLHISGQPCRQDEWNQVVRSHVPRPFHPRRSRCAGKVRRCENHSASAVAAIIYVSGSIRKMAARVTPAGKPSLDASMAFDMIGALAATCPNRPTAGDPEPPAPGWSMVSAANHDRSPVFGRLASGQALLPARESLPAVAQQVRATDPPSGRSRLNQ